MDARTRNAEINDFLVRLHDLRVVLAVSKSGSNAHSANFLRQFETGAGSLVGDVGRLVAKLEGRE